MRPGLQRLRARCTDSVFACYRTVMDEEIPLLGGRVTEGVVRVGDTVRRPCGAHSPFVHALLRDLEAQGFTAAPRLHGIDARGREILSYIPGFVPNDLGDFSLAQLHAAGALLCRFHDATTTLPWCAGYEVVCHQDFTPCNTVFDATHTPVAIIDFDSAAPGRRTWDLAYATWMWCDLGNRDVDVSTQATRIHALCAGYGQAPDEQLLADIVSWQAQELRLHSQHAEAHGLNADDWPPIAWTAACLAWVEQHAPSLLDVWRGTDSTDAMAQR